MNENKLLIESPLGNLKAVSTEKGLISLQFLNTDEKLNLPSQTKCQILNQLKVELTKYFQKELKKFSVPLDIQGTDFQKKVWQELLKIPYGKTVSYKQIAEKIGNDKASRAVGNANNKNKIVVLIPCHRVIGINNNLVGYAGGIDKKNWLLDRERV